MFIDKKRLSGTISIILVTAILTFTATSLLYYGLGYLGTVNVRKLTQVGDTLKKYYYKPVDDNKLMEGAVAGMADSLGDPYTVYFTKDQMNQFKEETEGSYVGIGVSITVDSDGLVTVVEPFPGSPAKEAGVLMGDKVVKIDNKDVTGYRDENLIVKMIRGKEGTSVRLTFYRPSTGKAVEYNIVRRKIKIDNFSSEMLEKGIGYIHIKQFDAQVASYFQAAVKNLLLLGMKGLVIDVRDDPGGYYEEVVAVAGSLLPKGSLIVYTEDRNKKGDRQVSSADGYSFPLVVITNSRSASASEILSGAIKDNKRGKLVGTRTFGKGLVQVTDTLGDGSGLKLTVSRYFTPSGVCIQGIGINPDVVVSAEKKYENLPVSQIPRQDDVQLSTAVKVLKDSMK